MTDTDAALKLAITEVIDRYFAALDQKACDPTTMRAIFAEDARVVRPNGAAMVGPDVIAESHGRSMGRFRATQHLTSGMIVDLADDRRAATFRGNLVAMHLWGEGHGDASVPPSDNYFVASGVITGRVTLGSGGWRIAEIANAVIWRNGVGFQQVLQTK